MKGRPKSASKAPSKFASPAKERRSKKPLLAEEVAADFFPIVAIGASAGGLEAYTEFFHALSVDTGMAFVLVQHLDPTHHSLLTEIIAKTTRMPVEEVKSGIKVRANRVYVIPPNYLMVLANSALNLTPRNPKLQPHGDLAINFFMRSLAQEQQEKAIGIVLSGTGGDGTSGLEEIKAEGGITFAQEPTSAKYDGMPRSAIDSGCVDFIMPPAEIAQELHEIRHYPYRRLENHEIIASQASTSGQPFPQQKAFAGVIEHLRKTSGVDFSQYKPNTIHRRALRRVMVLKLGSLDEYAQHLRAHPEEVQRLYDDVLIPVTSFFRDFETFEALKTQVYPSIVRDKANKGTIRMWAPGCSTGEETYSLAMTLLEFLGDKASSFQIQIFGTDLNEKGIEKARAGVYRESIAEEISKERLQRFFVKVDGGYRVNKAVRDLCVFARQNLANDPPFSQMNVVACRNLFIYIQPVLQRKIVPILHYALKPHGFLVLGSSESVAAFPDLFSVADKKHKIYARQETASRLHYDFAQRHYPSLLGKDFHGGALKPEGPAKEEMDVQAEADRVLLKNHTPPGVIVNSAMEVVQFRGRTTPYLEQSSGKPSVNVLKLARNGLALELRTLIAAAQKKGAPVQQEGVLFDGNGLKRILNLSVSPLGEKGEHGTKPGTKSAAKPSLSKQFFLILFEDVTPPNFPHLPARNRKKGSTSQQDHPEAKRLKRELAGTREALHSAVESEEALKEEFQSANEEILSANEELQSTNEELETSKEELQSANEELNTLNTELRNKNSELHDLSNDVTNFLNSTRIPVVMLDRRLHIRRFTPAADKLLKVVSSDIGRAFADIRSNIEIPGAEPNAIEQAIAKVLDSLQPWTGEVKDLEGRWNELSIQPYRTQDNKIDGVVLALQDIDAIKIAGEQLRKSSEFFRGIIDTVREPLLVLDGDLRVIATNKPFLTDFQVSGEETIGIFVYDLGNGQWNIPLLRTLLEQVLPKARSVTDFEVEWEFERIGHKIMLLNARTLPSTHAGEKPMIFLAVDDITVRRAANNDMARLAAIVSSSDDAIVRKDLNGIIETWNPGAERLFGYTPQEAIGQPVTMLMPPDRVNEEPGILDRIRHGKHIDHYESVRQRKDGTLLDVSLTISPISDAHGEIVGASKIARDITERKHAELALRESDERFRMVADNMSQLAWTCDQLGNVTWYNQRWLDYTGLTFKEMQGWDWSKVQHPDHLDRVVQGVRRSRDSGEIWEDTFPLRGKDGKYRWFLSCAIPIRAAGGEVVQWFGTNTDITEQKLAEAALIKSEKLAAAGRLAATLAHEINNPLQAVTNLLTLLGQSPSLDTEEKEYARIAREELGRVTHLTQQSLGFYRESIFPTAVNVEEMIDSILSLYAKRIAAKKITVTKQYQANEAPIASYPGEIRQVFSTLLMNAMEAAPDGGRFVVRISKSTDWTKKPPTQGLRITLADSGCGIPAHHAERIFEPFFTTKGENGTGLGLWVARGIVHRLGGSVHMRSSVQPEKSGTCFSVFLPNGNPKL